MTAASAADEMQSAAGQSEASLSASGTSETEDRLRQQEFEDELLKKLALME